MGKDFAYKKQFLDNYLVNNKHGWHEKKSKKYRKAAGRAKSKN